MTRSRLLLVLLLAPGALTAAGCEPAAPPSATLSGKVPAPGALLVDRAAASGLDFNHFNGMTGRYFFPEVFGSGAALFDYDNDGDLDVYLVQGGLIAGTLDETLLPPPRDLPLRDRLFRNDLLTATDGTAIAHFVDVTEASGLDATGYGMGVATGDYDNDGWIDLYVTNLAGNQLWHNAGRGTDGDVTFEDATVAAGVEERRWSVPALFFDYDSDGHLDLFVGNYVDFNLGTQRVCATASGEDDYCSPLTFRPETDRLWRNRGDGTFEDASARSGLDATSANTLGAIAADFDGDGLLDLYVANDWMPNFLWINQGNGTFRDEALLAGAAVNAEGIAEASMGVDAADFDDDGDEDLFLTHLSRETNTLYRNDGSGRFADVSVPSGLGMPSWELTGFGVAWLDLEHDGDLDLLAANGAIRKIESQSQADRLYPLAEPNQLFRNEGGGRFEDISELVGGSFVQLEVSRGAAVGDIDNDGDTDVLLSNNSGPVRLFLNQFEQGEWVGLRLLTRDGRDAFGARIELVLDDGSRRFRRVRTDGSYASASDPRIVVGLGGRRPTRARVHWPDGGSESFSELGTGRYHTLRQGEGRK